MLTVDDHGKIRRAFRDGMSIREIARTFGHSRRKVREILANPRPKPSTPPQPPPPPAAPAQLRPSTAPPRRDPRETFIPLAHDPGQRLECDFGHIHVDLPGGRRL